MFWCGPVIGTLHCSCPVRGAVGSRDPSVPTRPCPAVPSPVATRPRTASHPQGCVWTLFVPHLAHARAWSPSAGPTCGDFITFCTLLAAGSGDAGGARDWPSDPRRPTQCLSLEPLKRRGDSIFAMFSFIQSEPPAPRVPSPATERASPSHSPVMMALTHTNTHDTHIRAERPGVQPGGNISSEWDQCFGSLPGGPRPGRLPPRAGRPPAPEEG